MMMFFGALFFSFLMAAMFNSNIWILLIMGAFIVLERSKRGRKNKSST